MALHVTRQHQFHCLACGEPMDAGGTPALSTLPCPACKAVQIVPASVADLVLQEKLRPVMAGEIFRGMDSSLGRKVDILILKNTSGSHGPLVNATVRVYRALARLDHPYLQRIHRLVEIDGHSLIVTEPRAQSLATVTRDKRIPPGHLLNLAIQAAHGLEAAASAGMCHMSLRPSCFQLCANLTVHVMGFSPWNHPSLPEPPKGWPALAPAPFLAPEVRAGKRPDTQSDMHAFGACMLSFLTGQTPDNPRTVYDIFNGAKESLPKDWGKTLAALLAPKPSDRPENWTKVVGMLKSRSGKTTLESSAAGLEDLRERSTAAHSSLHDYDGKGPSGFMDGIMSADVELSADEMMGQVWSIAGPEDGAYLTSEQMANAKTESPVDILTRGVMNGEVDMSNTAMLKAVRVGEVD